MGGIPVDVDHRMALVASHVAQAIEETEQLAPVVALETALDADADQAPARAYSAANLAANLAFRHHDIRDIQDELAFLGLSSLGLSSLGLTEATCVRESRQSRPP